MQPILFSFLKFLTRSNVKINKEIVNKSLKLHLYLTHLSFFSCKYSATKYQTTIWKKKISNNAMISQMFYLLELDGGVLNGKSYRLFCFDSRSGVSSTTRLATRMASSSQPAMAATDLNLGLNKLSVLWPFPATGFGSFWSRRLCFGSSLAIF